MEQSAEIWLIVRIDEGKVERGVLEATYNGGKTLVGDRKAAFAMSHVDLLTWRTSELDAYCASAMRCGMPKIEDKGDSDLSPKKKIQSKPSNQFDMLRCGGGPIKQQLKRGLQFPIIMYRRV